MRSIFALLLALATPRFVASQSGGYFRMTCSDGGGTFTADDPASLYDCLSDHFWRPPATVVSVTDFGAVGDGLTDDTAALQAALDYAHSLGGATIKLSGTHVVSLSPTQWLRLYDNIAIIGNGPSTGIKVQDNNGDFPMLFGPNAPPGSLAHGYTNHVLLQNFLVDLNIINNPGADIHASDPSTGEAALLLYLYNDIRIEGVQFRNCAGPNTIILSGLPSTWFLIADSTFQFVQPPGTAPYDNSFVYTRATNFIIARNVFTTDIRPDQTGGRTALEVHAPGSGIVHRNTVINFQTGIIVAANNITVSENTLTGVNFGIFFASLVSDRGIANATVTGNEIKLLQVRHNQRSCGGIVLGYDVNYQGDYSSVVIKDNTVSFEEEGAGRPNLGPSQKQLHRLGEIV